MSDIINIPAVENSTLLAQNQLLTAQNEILQAQTEQLTTIARNLTSLVVSGITLKGTIGTGGTVTALPSTHGKGDAYIVIMAGTYAGASCAVGDVLVALGTSGTSASDWSRIAGFMASDGAAKYTIENYAGSSLLGTNQTIVSAFNALNSKLVYHSYAKSIAPLNITLNAESAYLLVIARYGGNGLDGSGMTAIVATAADGKADRVFSLASSNDYSITVADKVLTIANTSTSTNMYALINVLKLN